MFYLNQWISAVRERYTLAREGKGFSFLFTVVIGLGFFTTAITWSMYNVYIPAYLEDYLTKNFGVLTFASTLIGFIMVLDNIAAVLLQPWIGNISDNVWSRYGPKKKGRRMPFVVVGIPLGAVLFILLGVFSSDVFTGNAMVGFIFLLVTIGGFNISMALYRSPVVALMPDLVPREFRSRGNGIINLLGGVGALIALFIIPLVYRFSPLGAYVVVSVIMILCLFVLYLSIKEPKELKDVEVKEKVKIGPALRDFFRQDDKSMVFILFAVFSWFFGYNVIETFFSLYSINVLGILKEDASFILGVIALTFIIFAVPAGFIAKKIGRRNTILMGLAIIVAALTVAAIFSVASIPVLNELTTFIGMNIPKLVFVYVGCFFLIGMGWAFININSIVIVWELAGKDKSGMGTGVYYFFSAAAAITGPLIIGGIFDLIKLIFNLEYGEQYKGLFFFGGLFFLVAAILVLFVKSTGSEGVNVEEIYDAAGEIKKIEE